MVFEHSLSGIGADIGLGTITVAVTSHSHGQLEDGPRFVVENLVDGRCEGGRSRQVRELAFTVKH